MEYNSFFTFLDWMLWKDQIIFNFDATRIGNMKKQLGYTSKIKKGIFWFDTQSYFWFIKTILENKTIITYQVPFHKVNGSLKTWLWSLNVYFILRCTMNAKFCFKSDFLYWSAPKRKIWPFLKKYWDATSEAPACSQYHNKILAFCMFPKSIIVNFIE